MGDSTVLQPFSSWPDIWRQETQDNTFKTPPPLITKKWLCYRFDLVSGRDRLNYDGLYRKVLTPEVIEAMGATVAEIRSRRLKTFSRQQTMMLINLLGL